MLSKGSFCLHQMHRKVLMQPLYNQINYWNSTVCRAGKKFKHLKCRWNIRLHLSGINFEHILVGLTRVDLVPFFSVGTRALACQRLQPQSHNVCVTSLFMHIYFVCGEIERLRKCDPVARGCVYVTPYSGANYHKRSLSPPPRQMRCKSWAVRCHLHPTGSSPMTKARWAR